MNSIQELEALNHHAYLLIGNSSTHEQLIKHLGELKIEIQGNPDFFDSTFVNFTIEDSRQLKSQAETRPIHSSGVKIFIIQMNGITVEAQNALLKLLEEPPTYAHFFLIIPSAHILLPTVKSRLHTLGTGVSSRQKACEDAQQFIKASSKNRLEMIKDLMEGITKERKTKQDAVEFLNDIERALYDSHEIEEAKSAFISIEIARKYITDRAPSTKMLLEYVALSI